MILGGDKSLLNQEAFVGQKGGAGEGTHSVEDEQVRKLNLMCKEKKRK